jgi:hypothetical protein
LQAARDAGAQVLRIAFGWDAMEPERGRYDWGFWDDFVRTATRDFGLRLIPYICYTPKWAARDSGENFWRSPPRDPEDFARFVEALVIRYRADIRSWELWNEPDNRAYWLGTREEFAALVKAGSRAVRRADPKATVVLGGIAGETDFLDGLFRVDRIAPSVDVVNIHSYFETWHPDPIETLPAYVARAAEIVREDGENEPLWLAETGYSSVGGRAKVSDVYRAHFRSEHTEAAQATALVRTFLLALGTGELPLIAWYRLNDLPTTEDVIGDDNNRHLGLRALNGAHKPASTAFARIARWFVQPYRILKPEVTHVGPADWPVTVRAFALRDGRHLVAAWIGGAQSDRSTSSVTSIPEDTRRAVVRIRLPDVRVRDMRVTDAVGAAISSAQIKRLSGDHPHLELILRGGEALICEMTP